MIPKQCPIFELAKLGNELTPEEQAQVLKRYVHRYTKEHVPGWAQQPRPDGGRYPVQFESDEEWLANTFFQVTKAGALDLSESHCYACATWPENPELRK